MDAFVRRWNLIKLLLAGPLFRSEVLEQLQTLGGDEESPLSEASVSADIKALRKYGIGFRTLEDGAKRSRQAYELDLSMLDLFASPAEASALQAAVVLFEDLRLPDVERLRSLFDRIPVHVRQSLDAPYTGQILKIGNPSYDPRVLEGLQRGIRTGRMMRLTYRPLNREPRIYLVDRAQLTWSEGYLYLQAHCPEAEGSTPWHRNREFRLDRFQETATHPAVEVLDTPTSFEQVPAFEYRVWLSASMAAAFRKVPRRIRVLEEAPDGSRLVAITETIPLRAVRKVLSYGMQARVIEPDFIVTEVQSTIERMAGVLASPAGPAP